MKRTYLGLLALLLVVPLMAVDGCAPAKQTSTSGVVATKVDVPTQPNGLTIEQENVRTRLVEDNKPGAIKHLYVISAMSGDVLIYSTVRGKVTSSGKRLAPTTVIGNGARGDMQGFFVPALGQNTSEVLQDDGTYGSSVEYIYWWDTKGVYHQLYVTGGMIVQVSSQPLAVKHVILNFEQQ